MAGFNLTDTKPVNQQTPQPTEFKETCECKLYLKRYTTQKVDNYFSVLSMNRSEAVTYLKELLSVCSEMSPNAVSFEEQKTDNTVNVRLHIQGSIGENEKQAVHELAKKHSLQVKDNTEGVVIYNAT